MCLGAVQKDGMALDSVPNEFKDEEMCKLAVTKNGFALSQVPKQLRTYDLCLQSVSGDGSNGSAIDFIPEEFKTKEILLQAVLQKPDMIEKIQYEKLDQEIILASGNREHINRLIIEKYFKPEYKHILDRD